MWEIKIKLVEQMENENKMLLPENIVAHQYVNIGTIYITRKIKCLELNQV